MSRLDADLCVCVLFYGADAYCEKLAARLLNPAFLQLASAADVRFGLNAVSAQTRQLVSGAVSGYFPDALVIDCPENIFKYPMMRRLFYSQPIAAPLTLWFDDDSCLIPDTDVENWLGRIKKQLTAYTILGSVYRDRFVGNQIEWVKTQPWYRGKPVGPYVQFVAGGWWAIQTAALQALDWPGEELKHRGGDVMLGEALRQNDMKIGHFRDNLWINANDFGVEAKSSRRGMPEAPIGFDYAAV